jgi:hypothetical protein
LWHRSGLPAGDFAPLVGVSKHTLCSWKQKFEADGPAGLADQLRDGPAGRVHSDGAQDILTGGGENGSFATFGEDSIVNEIDGDVIVWI